MNVGDKVVNIGAPPSANLKVPTGFTATPWPVLGQVYVIGEVHWQPSYGTTVGLGLVGVVARGADGSKGYWDSRCFRPLDEVQAENRAKVTDAIGKDIQP